jgi:hypothetical protein
MSVPHVLLEMASCGCRRVRIVINGEKKEEYRKCPDHFYNEIEKNKWRNRFGYGFVEAGGSGFT